ncbi:MAG: sensor histidine kinase [Synechococcales bacterium]|nr:sensor histidine kinase [Synechococcales bacterium]
MSDRAITPRTHPFPFLLYLEWVMLAITLISQILPIPRPFGPEGSPLTVTVSVVLFGLMGLRLPTGKPIYKAGYTAVQVALVLVATIAGVQRLRLFPLFYLVLVFRSCLIFRMRGRLIITALTFLLFLSVLIYRIRMFTAQGPPPPRAEMRLGRQVIGLGVNSLLLFGLVLLLVLLLVNALIAERESRDKLAQANTQLRRYALRAENLAMEQERNRIARDIHDSLGHSLTALNLQIEGALKLWEINPTQSHTFLAEAKRLGSMALQEVRQSVAAMRTNPLQDKSMDEAIALLLQDFQHTTQITPSCTILLHHPLAPDLMTAVYRVVQEALTNICKYAEATTVVLVLQTPPASTEAPHLELSIRDNGQGFDLSQNQTGFGIQGMRERVLAFGGEFAIASAPGQGCHVQARIPLMPPVIN